MLRSHLILIHYLNWKIQTQRNYTVSNKCLKIVALPARDTHGTRTSCPQGASLNPLAGRSARTSWPQVIVQRARPYIVLGTFCCLSNELDWHWWCYRVGTQSAYLQNPSQFTQTFSMMPPDPASATHCSQARPSLGRKISLALASSTYRHVTTLLLQRCPDMKTPLICACSLYFPLNIYAIPQGHAKNKSM